MKNAGKASALAGVAVSASGYWPFSASALEA
jgi:hypothetical protein